MEFLNRRIEQIKSDHILAASSFCGYDYFDDPMTTCGEEQEGKFLIKIIVFCSYNVRREFPVRDNLFLEY